MTTLKIKVYAKLNLFLDVVGVCGQYHKLSSTVVSVDIFDRVEITPRADTQVAVNSILNLPSKQNIAFKAAQAFVSRFGTLGCNISIQKGIPPMSGLGGSSADASAVIFGLSKLYGIDDRAGIESLANSLGSDVLFMLTGGLAKMSGRGDVLQSAQCCQQYHLALTTFEQGVSTQQAFEQYDRLAEIQGLNEKSQYTAQQVFEATKTGNLTSDMLFNALSIASASLSNYAEGYLKFARGCGLVPCMTGSGSAYFVLCDSKSHAQQISALLTSKGFATTAVSTKPHGIEVV